ncbi:MAG: DsbE family thiol:disulfide interchange protein, partial [Porticoccaceae bacterium]
MANLKLFVPLLVFLILATVLFYGLGRDPTAMPSALIDRPMPAFKLPSLGEPTTQLDQSLFKGSVSLLNVWATWCPSCRAEHAFLTKIAGQGVPIIGVNYKDDSDAARRWLADYGNPYTANIVDADGTFGLDLGVFGAPETYVIDKDG